MKKLKYSILAAVLILAQPVFAQWVSINPGAGGQVQDVVPDPNTEGRLILASDMEGIYESTNHGESWHPLGDLHQNRVYAVGFVPGNNNKLFVGTLYGLEMSTDGGATFELVDITQKISIASIAVDPNDANNVLAGIGWNDDYGFEDNFGMSANGKGSIFRSTDGGTSWTEIFFDNGSSDRNVYSIDYDPANTSNVYIGSNKGIFKSTDGGASWSNITKPSGAGSNKGVAVSPDGTKLYAVFSNRLYATPTASINWVQSSVPSQDYWFPEVDVRSTASEHKIIIASRSRAALHEVTFNWEGDTHLSNSYKVIWQGLDDFDPGWDLASPNARFAHYTPASWDRALWSTTNQTIFQGTPGGSNGWGWEWHNKYSDPNPDIQAIAPAWGNSKWDCYSGKGTESTYSYDIAIDENYVIQGQADNGPVESWDGGTSWSNVWHRAGGGGSNGWNLSDVQAVTIASADGVPTVLAQMSEGYGGAIGSAEGRLYAKKLVNHSPDDQWVFLAGGKNAKGGLPTGPGGKELRGIEVSPAKPDRVFIHAANTGMYIIDDLGAALDAGVANVTKIMTSGGANPTHAKKISPHPIDPDIVFFNGARGTTGVWKGEKTGPEIRDWTWTKILSSSSWDSEVVVWEHHGQVYLFHFGTTSGVNGFAGMLSLDEGETWTKVIEPADIKLINEPSWYDAIKNDYNFTSKGGVVGYDDQLIVSYYDHRQQKTYGIYKGTITGNTVDWAEWTDGLHFGGFTSGRIANDDEGVRHLYVTTAGAGAWKRLVEPEGPPPPAPDAPDGLGAVPNSGYQIDLGWNDNADNETGFKIEMKSGTDDFELVGSTLYNSTSYTVAGLKPLTAYTFRVYAYNSGGNSEYSSEVSATTLEPEPVPDEPTALAAQVISGKQINLSWTDHADNEKGFKIEVKSGSGDFELVGTVEANETAFKSLNLVAKTAYTYRVFAFNDGGNSAYSNEKTATTAAGSSSNCENPNLISNGGFEEDGKGWELYTNGAAKAAATYAPVAGFANGKTAYIDISSISGSDADIQLIYPFGSLIGKTNYTVKFKAKASEAKTFRLSVLKNESPWTSFLTENVTLSTEVKEYGPFALYMDQGTSNLRLDFFLGGTIGDVWIDDIVLVSTEECIDTGEVLEVQMNNCKTSLEEGETLLLSANVLPTNAADRSITWTSTDSGVLSVSDNGLVTALSSGSATIKVESVSSGLSDVCTIEVIGSDIEILEVNSSFSAPLIYPNPTQSVFNVDLRRLVNQMEIKIFTLIGNQVYKKSYQSIESITIEGLNKGLYFIEINGDGIMTKERIIVQ